MKKHIVRLFAYMVVMLICITNTVPYQAEEQAEKVRVGIYEMDGFHYYNKDGELEGYCIDYLNVLSALTGWEYEYVEVADFMEGCEKLERGDLDLMAPAMMTDARRAKFAYSELSFGTEYTVLVTKEDKSDLYYQDYENFEGMKVAVLKDYPLTEYFISYMDVHGFEAELVYYNTADESNLALKNKLVDAVVTSIMDVREGQTLLARFSPQPFYFLMNKENAAFQVELNQAMQQIQSTYPTLLEELLVAYYPIYEQQFFTREEAEYIENARTLRVAYVSGRKPLSYTDESGELAGISREIFDRISELSGLQFEYVELPEGDINYDFLLEQKIDLITGVEYNSTNMNAKGIFMSRPYISARKVMVSQQDFKYKPEKIYKLAVAAGSQTIQTVLNNKYPNLKVVNYETNEECFLALFKGEVDMLIQNQYVVEGVLSKPLYSDFVVVPVDGIEDELCFSTIVSLDGTEGMDEEESERIISILNKTIAQISSTELDNIVVRGALEHQYEADFIDFLYSYRFTIAVLVAVFCIACFLFWVYRKEKKRYLLIEEEENRRNALQQKRYKTIMDCSEDMIYEISMNGESSVGSEKIKEKFGWEIPKEVEELDFAKAMKILHVHPEDEPIFRQTMLANGIGKFDEQIIRIGKEDGTYLWCKVSRTLLVDDNDNVVSILGKITDVDEEVKEKKKLEFRSRTDPLTGLLNKITFEKEVRDYVEKNSTEDACFIFLDMDHFKEINDRFGHGVGDQVIKETAKKMQLLFANFDLVSRFGGDEFCVFVKEMPRDTLIDRLKFAVKKMEQEYPYEGGCVKLSASIGVAYCKKSHSSYKELMEVADEAVYQAKDNGRNCYIIKDVE